jgi:hypothetical protein
MFSAFLSITRVPLTFTDFCFRTNTGKEEHEQAWELKLII